MSFYGSSGYMFVFFPALERQAEGAAQLILDSILPLEPTSIQ